MVDRRFWSNIVYILIVIVVCITVWQITPNSNELPTVSLYTLYTSNASYSHPIHTLLLDDYHHLIDLNFTFTVVNFPCNESSPILLVLVHSDPRNFETRKTLRQTWGQNTQQVKVLFLTGSVPDKDLRERVEKENDEFGDFIQGSFVDAYRNMTYKHVMAFKYAIYHCPHAKYILKTDDDVFVNMPLMVSFLTAELSPFGGSRMLFCSVRKHSMVLRSWRSKWRVSFKEYPAKTYPPYCPGWAILYSPDVVFELYRQAQRTDYFWIDDVHITGTLASKIHLSHVNVDNLVLTKRSMTAALEPDSGFNRSFLYGAPNVNREEIKVLWKRVQKQPRVSLLNYLDG